MPTDAMRPPCITIMQATCNVKYCLQTVLAELQVLEQEIHPFLPGFKDTPFILYLLKSQPKYLDRVYFEQEITINRHWLQVWH